MAQDPNLMSQAQDDPLAQLRDIHLPPALDLWPPAFGWWLLLLLAVLLALATIWFFYRRWQAQAYRREGLDQLQQLFDIYTTNQDSTAYLAGCLALLKRVALTRYPRDRVARLTGEDWVNFLDESANTDEFSMGAGQALVTSGYEPEPAIDVPRLHKVAEFWIKEHKEAA